MKFWNFRKKSKEAEDRKVTDLEKGESGLRRLSCGLLRRDGWASFTSLRPEEWKRAVKKYKKRWSARRRYAFCKLKTTDRVFTDVVLGKALGSGASGTVYVADLNGQQVAVKIVNSNYSTEKEVPETSISKISHHNLLQILAVRQNVDSSHISEYEDESRLSLSWDSFSSGSFTELAKGIPSKEGGAFFPQQETWIMMEYCDLGSLSDGILEGRFHRSGKGHIPIMERILMVANQVADAMACLHRMAIVHGDLKAQNVFLKTALDTPLGFVTKVGDFGSSQILKKQNVVCTNLWGTVDHMPPEVLRDGEVRTATDVFSFGMMLLHLITGKRPFLRKTSASILVAIVEGVRPEIPDFVPPPFAELIRDCWHQEWQQRPEFKDIRRRISTMVSDADLMNLYIDDKIKARLFKDMATQSCTTGSSGFVEC